MSFKCIASLPLFREKDGRPDRSYFSPDCFHLSQRAHTLMARALWNNMVSSASLRNVSILLHDV